MDLDFKIEHTFYDGQRLLIDPLTRTADTDPRTRRFGIKVHTCFEATIRKILHFFGLAQGIIEANFNGKNYYLNKGSLKNWCLRHEVTLDHPKLAAVKIQDVAKKILSKQEEMHEKIKEIALARLELMIEECFNEDGTLKHHDANFENPKEYTLLPNTLFYHGTTSTSAQKIRRVGFDIFKPAKNGKIYGAGLYLSPNLHVARSYSDYGPNSILKYKLKPDVKIASNTLFSKYHSSIFNSFNNLYKGSSPIA